MELEKGFQDKADGSLEESTQACDACETLKIKETKLCLQNDTITKENLLYWKTFKSWKTN